MGTELISFLVFVCSDFRGKVWDEQSSSWEIGKSKHTRARQEYFGTSVLFPLAGTPNELANSAVFVVLCLLLNSCFPPVAGIFR